ncbi:histidine acid phosphatase-like protein [Xylogone sp. PMI_703]|nr:histidine acid phosphatase-like protein [Xylogone sp. PMI_703]
MSSLLTPKSLLALALFFFSSTNAVITGVPITWSTIIYALHGEKIPTLHPDPNALTPLGANQLLDAGSLIRSRYITSESFSDDNSSIPLSGPINDISIDAIDNTQLYIASGLGSDTSSTTSGENYLSGSAQAFVQGLYPPNSGLSLDEDNILSNGSAIDFPLEGYQYPTLASFSNLDYNYIWTGGNIDCQAYTTAQSQVSAGQDFQTRTNDNTQFYQSVYPKVFGALDPTLVTYANAYALYEYALYEYNHNETVSENLSGLELYTLAQLATEHETALNTPTSTTNITSIAGQTLSSFILQQMEATITTSGGSDKLTLLVGSYEPMLSFFALAQLSGSTGALSQFNSMPSYGSMMVFELFSYGSYEDPDSQAQTTVFPSLENLWVRFSFRNGTNGTDLVSYPLFARGNSESDMSWSDFAGGIQAIEIAGVSEWCSACQSTNLFCTAIAENSGQGSSSGSSSGHKGLSAAIGGVIGATVTLATVLAFVMVLGLLGFRIEHVPRSKGAADLGVLRRSSDGPNGNGGTGGGFKGAEKLASDTDLTTKVGAGGVIVRHERVGSWEMKSQEASPEAKHGSMDRVVSTADYNRKSEEAVDPFADPVRPTEQV